MNCEYLYDENNLFPEPIEEKELLELFRRMKNGDNKVRNEIIKHNIRLVMYIVNTKLNNTNYDKNDLVSIGIIGLIQAVDRFDETKKVKFVTYATKCIKNEISKVLMKTNNDKQVLSINDVIRFDKDGNGFTLEEVLSDNKDFTEEIIKSGEIIKKECIVLRNIVNELYYPNDEIIKMRFGFYDNRVYTQTEIANKLNLSPSHISRLITKILNKIKMQYKIQIQLIKNEKIEIEEETTELNEEYETNSIKNDESFKKTSNTNKKLKTIYQILGNYSKAEVNNVLSKLSEDEKRLIELRYGSDLDHPITSEYFDKETSKQFYSILVPKIKNLLANPDYKVRKKSKNIYEFFSDYTQEEVDDMLNKLSTNEKVIIKLKYENGTKLSKETKNIFYAKLVPKMRNLLVNKTDIINDVYLVTKKDKEEQIQIQIQENYNSFSQETNDEDLNVTTDDYVILRELFKQPNFNKMLYAYSIDEVTIVSLKLGLVNNKCFSTEQISNLLDIDEQKIGVITTRVLNDCKEQLNNLIDLKSYKVAEDKIVLNLKKLK